MFGLLFALLVGWVLVAIVAALVGGLFWLTIVGAVLFFLTVVLAGARSSGPTPR